MHETSHCGQIESTALSVSVHIALEVLLAEFENKDEFLLGVDDIVEANDVGVTELLHKRDFSDGSRGSALLSIEVDFFEGDNFIGGPGTALTKELNKPNTTAR